MASTVLKENSLLLPAGTTAERPTASTGMVRYNSSYSTIEYYNGVSWVAIGLQDGSTQATAAPSASYIKTLTGTTSTGKYWIKNTSMAVAVEVYCDMSYDGGGYMLLAYGYVGTASDNGVNYAIPNLNHDGTIYSYNPTSRASTHGMIATPNSQKSALLIAKASSTFLMAAGGNPATGGIDSYDYVYKFPIPNPAALTFENHGVDYTSNQSATTVTVTGLKGHIGSYTRACSNKSLGSTWNDSYPTGYGAVVTHSGSVLGGNFDVGPFFPSIHPRGAGFVSSPDVGVNGFQTGSRTYTFRGWYSANGNGNTGQTSIWVK